MDHSSIYKKVITAVFVTLLLLGVAVWLFNNGAFSSHSDKSVTISKETTYLEGPLTEDGYVDYIAALNEQHSEGVTPENNAAVPLWLAFGPGELPPEIRWQFFKMLNIPQLPQHGNYLIEVKEYAKSVGEEKLFTLDPSASAEEIEKWRNPYQQSMERPWSKEEFPLIARWLDIYDRHINFILEASSRPRMYAPLISLDDDEGPAMLLNTDLSTSRLFRQAAYILVSRAMLRVHEGKIEEAWQDILACHRLARRAGQGPTVIECLMANSVEAIACRADGLLVLYGNLTQEQAQRFQTDLKNLTPMPKMYQKLDEAERYVSLQIMAIFSSGKLGTEEDPGPFGGVLNKPVLILAFDCDEMLRVVNSEFDQVVDAAKRQNHRERMTALEKINLELEKRVAESRSPVEIAKAVVYSRKKRSAMMAEYWMTLVMPNHIKDFIYAQDRATARFQLAQLGYALAGYRAEHNEYPEALSQLAPEYIDPLPKDLFSGNDFRYKREQEGYLLFSVGTNGKDDGGQTFNSKPRGDDLVIDTRPKLENEKYDKD